MTAALKLSMLAASSAAVLALSGCTADETTGDADLVAGKQLFVQKCGSCHTLARAGTKGTQGPNLDTAFANPRGEGFGESAIRGMVREMIDIGAAHGTGGMVPDIVKGDDAANVAAYVAKSAAVEGEDEGLLASAVKAPGSGGPIAAENGVLTIPADPNGQLAFVSDQATAPVGELKVVMPNESGVLHDIVIDGKGEGEQVTQGESTFTATFAAGKYTYYCSVEGHRQAGMEGTLTVK
jgi:mono/diheme cytochrome c family protein